MKDNYSWLEKCLIDCYKVGLDHGVLTAEYGVGVVLEKRESPVRLAKTELISQIEIEKLRARIDEMHKYAQRGTDSEIPYFNQRLADLTEKLKELESMRGRK